jgi:hypothetical protein
MKTLRTFVAGSLILLLGSAAPALAQDRHIVPSSALKDAVAAKAATETADRAAGRAVLAREEVRAVAAKTGLDLDRAAASVDTLSANQLAQAAAAARQIDQSLVGGASTVTISTTTIIIALLILIIILVAD